MVMGFAVRRLVAGAALAALGVCAQAQSSGEAKPGDLDRAQKQADAVFRWIKVHTDKPAAAPAPAAAKPAPAPAPVVAKRPAPPPAPQSAAARPPSNGPESGAPSVQASAASEPAPEATVVAAEASPASSAEPGAPVVLASAAPSPAPSPAVQTAAQAGTAPAAAEPEEDMPLRLITKVEPNIPRHLRKSLSSGTAQVKFTVEPDGRVSQASTMTASNIRFANIAVEAIKQWRFAPIKRAQEAAVEVNFNGDE